MNEDYEVFSGWTKISGLPTGDFREKEIVLSLKEDTDELIWYFRTQHCTHVRGTSTYWMRDERFDDIPYSALLQDY